MRWLLLAWVVSSASGALDVSVRPRVALAPATIAIKVRRIPHVRHRTLMVAIVDEATPIRVSEIDLSDEPRRMTWDFMWNGIPPCQCMVIAAIWPTEDRVEVSVEVK